MTSPKYVLKDVVYENPLAKAEDIAGFVPEGSPLVSFPAGRMRLENAIDPAEGQSANYLFWCPVKMPADIAVTWTFRPIREPGLAMFWIAADGQQGRDLFDPSLAKRTGDYRQYHSGDIHAYHASYFRRKNVKMERTFHTCNLRRSAGFHLVAQGADPIPSVIDVLDPYRIEVLKCRGWIRFSVNDLCCYEWFDDGQAYGPALGAGYIGFRQMAPLIAEYGDLCVRRVRPDQA